jgi:cyclin-dependent kinase 12/13
MQGKVKGSRPGGVYMVFEYLDADLEGILKTPQVRLSAIHVKTFMKQLLEGIQVISII